MHDMQGRRLRKPSRACRIHDGITLFLGVIADDPVTKGTRNSQAN
jgi:hypothetical protein